MLHPTPPARGFVVVVVSVIVAALLRLALDAVLGRNAPFLPFLIAVTVSAYVGGLWPGVLATILGAATGALFVPWGEEATFFSLGRVLFFGLAGLIVAIACEQLHRLRREAEERAQALRDSETRFRVLAESVPSIVWTAAPNGTMTWSNQRWYEFCGLTPEQTAQDWVERVVHPDDRERYISAWTKSLETSSEFEIEVRNRRRDGSYHWFVTRATPLRDSAGQVELWVGVTTDIDDQKRTEEALRDSEERFRTLAQAAPMLVWAAGSEGESQFSNSRWAEYTGQSPDQARGRGWIEAVHPDDRPSMGRAWRTACETGRLYEVEYRLHRAADGQYRRHLARAWPQRDRDGRVARWVGCATDIEDQKRAEDTLREADRRKDEFLAVLAHELRNPLAPIRNAAEALKTIPGMPPASTAPLNIIERQVRHLARLVDDLMDVSRIARGKIRLAHVVFDLCTAVRQAVEISRPLIEARKHEFEVLLPSAPIFLNGDPSRIAQVVSNLLNNAAKYTPDGGAITLTVERAESAAEVRVRDTGLGISSNQLDSLFRPFAQLDTSLNRSEGGLGVGLSLVRALAELHGGTVAAVSEGPNRGSEFVVRLPVVQAALDETETPSPAFAETTIPLVMEHAFVSKRVLVVDDNEDAAESLAALLEISGYEVRTAFNGLAALALAEDFNPDAILLDIGMPGMNGYEVASRLRVNEMSRNTILVALTGWGHDDDRRKTREAGFDHHLVKPVEPHDIHALLTSAGRESKV